MADTSVTTASTPSNRRLRAEVLIVLGLSLGQSAVFAIWRIVERATRPEPIGEQSATINNSVAQVSALDLTYQVLRIGFSVVPVLLALYLLSSHGRSALARLGMDRAQPRRDLAWGFGLAALIGIPGIGVYVGGRALGLTVQINASGLNEHWWTLPILILAALAAGLLEETIAVGYLVTRLRELAWGTPATIVASAVLRGSYHLYQGVGQAVGNALMGAVFAWFFVRKGRVLPLVIAHATLDVVAFVGFAYLPDTWLNALGIT